MSDLSREDAALERLWRDRFAQPLPMRGAGQAIKTMLVAQGLSLRTIEEAIRLEARR